MSQESTAAKPHPPRRRGGGVVVPHRPKWYQRLAAAIVVALIKLVAATLRTRVIDKSEMAVRPNVGSIFCVWHNRLGLTMPAYFDYVRSFKTTPGMAAMVSASKDGALLASVLEGFGVEPVRGSSSRRGPQALLELTTWARSGYDLAITPDGPRGPSYQIQEGIMALAQLSGLPIVPFTWYVPWKIKLRSWDKFQIPLPFSKCELRFGPSVFVPRRISPEDREALRKKIEKDLLELSTD